MERVSVCVCLSRELMLCLTLVKCGDIFFVLWGCARGEGMCVCVYVYVLSLLPCIKKSMDKQAHPSYKDVVSSRSMFYFSRVWG